ncbi:MAG TPA: tetratricopeptide repeat protein [Nitrososphaeraceae archaeon]|nr:tetratricopeptide repeat protein [Nitrososphaeraceae archaeon]
MNESFIVIIILVILLYSFQSFFHPFGNNTNAFAISKELEHDNSSIIQIISTMPIKTESTTEVQQSPCPEDFFIKQTSNKCQKNPLIPTAEEYFNEGRKQSQKANYTEAIEYYDKAIELDPSFALAYYNKDLPPLENLDRIRQAISTYRQALSINPSYKGVPKATEH